DRISWSRCCKAPAFIIVSRDFWVAFDGFYVKTTFYLQNFIQLFFFFFFFFFFYT
ncbi:phosphatidylinositol 3-kinase regulatory subunit gamma isoform X1, partial [Arapaima gigas]